MFKMILSTIVALGLGSVAYAADPAADAPKMDAPATDAPAVPAAGDHMKKGHGAKMAKDDMKADKKAAKKDKKKKTEETH